MSIAILPTSVCRGCGRQLIDSAMYLRATYVDLCERCHHGNQEALASLAEGRPPKSCALCGKDFQDESNLRVYLHEMGGGVKAWACQACSDRHVRRHAAQYRGTPFGAQKGL